MTLKLFSDVTGGRFQNETPIDVLTVGAGGVITLPGNLLLPAGVLKQGGNKKYGCVAYLNASANVSFNSNQKIPYNATLWNPNGSFSIANNRFTPDVAGWYQVNVTASFTGSAASDNCQGHIAKNGSIYMALFIVNMNSASVLVCAQSGSQLVYMNGTTDYLEATIYRGQASGTVTLNGDAAGTANRFSAVLVYPD